MTSRPGRPSTTTSRPGSATAPGTASSPPCGGASARPPAETPTRRVACIDSQSVKTAYGGEEVGTDGGKKVRGRKRHIVVDTMGLLLAVVVTAANVDDARAAQELFAQMPGKDFPRLEVVQADNKYHNHELDRWLRVHHRPY